MVAQGGATVADSELQVRAVTDALLAAAQAKEYRSMATNTGGVKWNPKKEVKKKVLSAEQIVDRMRVSYPALRAAKVDSSLR